MQLNILESTADSVRAGYDCRCGCTPTVDYRRSGPTMHEGCCCGNEFHVGPKAASELMPGVGFHAEHAQFVAPWGETLHASWLVGPSVHPDQPTGGEHAASAGHDHRDDQGDGALDPVCGMTVDRTLAASSGLHLSHGEIDYYFCGRGCKLEFGDDPGRFLDPAYSPSM